MSERITTDSMLRRIFRTKNLTSFLQRNDQSFETADFCTLLRGYCTERKCVPERIIISAQIDRTYGHQLFNGTRKPSRDKVLQLAVAMKLSLNETQHLLQAAGKSALYPRLKRDAVVIYCLKNELDMMETQEILSKAGLSLLGEV